MTDGEVFAKRWVKMRSIFFFEVVEYIFLNAFRLMCLNFLDFHVARMCFVCWSIVGGSGWGFESIGGSELMGVVGSESIGGSFMFSIVGCVDVEIVSVQIVANVLMIPDLCGEIANTRLPACIGLSAHGQCLALGPVQFCCPFTRVQFYCLISRV